MADTTRNNTLNSFNKSGNLTNPSGNPSDVAQAIDALTTNVLLPMSSLLSTLVSGKSGGVSMTQAKPGTAGQRVKSLITKTGGGLLDNMDNIILTIPTYDAPSWVRL